MARIKHIMVICGEASGDLNASCLIKEILKVDPQIKISGVGAELMRKAGSEVYYDIRGLAVLGFFDALKKLPKFFALRKLILRKIRQEAPDAIILVDFSGFNLRLAKKINNALPVIYYISPQVWASRPGRIKTIKKYVSKLIAIFKFEREFYKRYGVNADFPGHPLLDIVGPAMEKKEFLAKHNLSDAKNTLALLPGSRTSEVKNILPLMLEAALLISKEISGAQFVIAKSPQVDWSIYKRLKRPFNIDLKIIEDETYDCLNSADFALVASGTATLEAAIMQKPFVVIYKMGLANYLLYRPQVRLPYIGMVNIAAGRKIIPEFIQFQARPAKIARRVLEILKNPSLTEAMQKDLAQVKSSLGEAGASSRAAQLILDFLGTPMKPIGRVSP